MLPPAYYAFKKVCSPRHYLQIDLGIGKINIPAMQVENEWQPKGWGLPEAILKWYYKFSTTVSKQFKMRYHLENNLLPFQKHLLKDLATCKDILIVSCNKNSGLAIIDTKTTLNWHLKPPPYTSI